MAVAAAAEGAIGERSEGRVVEEEAHGFYGRSARPKKWVVF